MNVDHIMIVARKELKEIKLNKGTWISALFFALFFAATNIGSVTSGAQPGRAVSIDWYVMYLSLFIGVFSGFMLCGAVFFREKQSGVVETLLCTPLSLRSIWLGKVLGVALPSYLFALFSAGVLAVLSTLMVGAVAAPSLLVIVHLVLVTPLFTAAAVGIVGYIQLAMGMRENRIVSMGIFVLLIAGLSVSTGVVQENASLVNLVVLALLAVATVLFALSFLLSKRLNKEKIVTTIPD
jgi:ABC-2 type transport system permease protein